MNTLDKLLAQPLPEQQMPQRRHNPLNDYLFYKISARHSDFVPRNG